MAQAGTHPTMTKAEVHYRRATTPTERCGRCSMFREPRGCTLVKGTIRQQDVCDKFKPAK